MTLLDRSVVPLPLWAKLERTDAETDLSWHSLVDHSADVAACMETLLALPLVQSRLAALAGVERLPDVWVPRIAAHVFFARPRKGEPWLSRSAAERRAVNRARGSGCGPNADRRAERSAVAISSHRSDEDLGLITLLKG
jgi:HD domain